MQIGGVRGTEHEKFKALTGAGYAGKAALRERLARARLSKIVATGDAGVGRSGYSEGEQGKQTKREAESGERGDV